jgi:hypothetical protein
MNLICNLYAKKVLHPCYPFKLLDSRAKLIWWLKKSKDFEVTLVSWDAKTNIVILWATSPLTWNWSIVSFPCERNLNTAYPYELCHRITSPYSFTLLVPPALTVNSLFVQVFRYSPFLPLSANHLDFNSCSLGIKRNTTGMISGLPLL